MLSVKREIIVRRPELFKVAALKDIKRLFPHGTEPFYAGFGNREPDAISYRSVEIPLKRIFIINPAGEVHQLDNSETKTYNMIRELVPIQFPKVQLLKYLHGDVTKLQDI